MSQTKIVKAFRNRLENAGYTDISVKYQYTTFANGRMYRVSAREPLSWQEVLCLMSEKQMRNKYFAKNKFVKTD